MSENETLEIKVDITDQDFKNLEKGRALMLAYGTIGATPIQITLQRRGKGPAIAVELVSATDEGKILSLIPKESAERPHIKREDLQRWAMAKWNMDVPRVTEAVNKLLREGTIYEPRPGCVKRTT